ncbi:MAG: DUF3108 domain-containing protein [Acetobacteraceae bacterium]|nr:DUF3108 domain-containing protein [Acetobacteraceae bacterium]
MMRPVLAVLAAAVPLLGISPARAADGELHASYDTYAAGLDVAEVEAGFGLGPWSYQVRLAYHTTGFVGFFYRGHQFNEVDGSWREDEPVPTEFSGEGEWRGQSRLARIDYRNGHPQIRTLVPPNEAEREVVPDALQANSIDTLSALADLIRHVADTGRCETVVHTYDGRRATEITAVTVGEEVLAPTSRSSFSGPALRCDFTGQMVAGFKFNDDQSADRKPLHGSAWLARVVPGAPPVPVRMTFETRWFGTTTMYLKALSTGAQAVAAVH